MKEFQDFRTQLAEGLEEHVVISHSSMPPNILILRRKTVRQFPNNTMVALYYNDKLDQYFSIPYGGDVENAITPVSLKEAQELMEDRLSSYKEDPWMANFDKHVRKVIPYHAAKINWHEAGEHHRQGTSPEDAAKKYVAARQGLKESEQLNEDIMDRLHHIRTSKISRNIDHNDGTKTMNVEPETAHAVLRHHSQLTGTAQEEFEQKVRGSRHTFGKAAFEARTGKVSAAGVDKHNINEISIPLASWAYHERQSRGLDALKKGDYKTAVPYLKKAVKTIDLRSKMYKREQERGIHESIESDPISTLRNIVHGHAISHMNHNNGTQTRVDPTTAKMLLTVHDALHPDNRMKFSGALKHSQSKFNKIVDFGWKQVR